MGLVDHPDAQQGPRNRDLGLLRENPQVVPRFGMEDAVASQDDRPLRRRDLGRRKLQLPAVTVEVRPEARQPGDDLCLRRMPGGRLLLQRVLGDVDVNRAGAPGAGDVERLGDDARQVVGVADQVIVLGHRQGDAVDVDLLEGVLADQGARDVARDRDHRHRVEKGGPDPRDEVRRAGSGGAHAHAHATRHPCVAVRRMCPALLVPDQHVAELRVVTQDVIQRQDHATGVAEEHIDALAEQRFAQDVGTDPGPPQVAGLVEHPLPGSLHGGRFRAPGVRHVTASHRRRSRGAARTLRRVAPGDRHGPGSSVMARCMFEKTKDPRRPARVRVNLVVVELVALVPP